MNSVAHDVRERDAEGEDTDRELEDELQLLLGVHLLVRRAFWFPIRVFHDSSCPCTVVHGTCFHLSQEALCTVRSQRACFLPDARPCPRASAAAATGMRSASATRSPAAGRRSSATPISAAAIRCGLRSRTTWRAGVSATRSG